MTMTPMDTATRLATLTECIAVETALLKCHRPESVFPNRCERKSGIHQVARTMWAMRIFLLFVATAIAEIVGCYLPYLWLKQGKSVWLLLPAVISLVLFVWLLTLHETAAGRVYAAYGGVYVAVALMWLWAVDHVRPTPWDYAGVCLALVAMGIIMFQPRP